MLAGKKKSQQQQKNHHPQKNLFKINLHQRHINYDWEVADAWAFIS